MAWDAFHCGLFAHRLVGIMLAHLFYDDSADGGVSSSGSGDGGGVGDTCTSGGAEGIPPPIASPEQLADYTSTVFSVQGQELIDSVTTAHCAVLPPDSAKLRFPPKICVGKTASRMALNDDLLEEYIEALLA